MILHEDADDALQNTFLNAWRNIGYFRSESSLYTWLYSIATNEALALINKRKRNNAVSIDDLGTHFADSAGRKLPGLTVMKPRYFYRMPFSVFLKNNGLYSTSDIMMICLMRR